VFPGSCDRCGGPQSWTIYAGEVYVRCQLDCSEQLVIEGFDTLPPDGEDPGFAFAREVEGTKWREGVVSPEGGAAKETDSKDCDPKDLLPF